MEKEEEKISLDPGPGMLHVYTGDGKGKTTASLGLALRASGHGYKSFIIQFMKNPETMGVTYGEHKAIAKLGGIITIRAFGPKRFIHSGEASEEDRQLARKALEMAREKLRDKQIKLLILDEIFVALFYKLITLQDILDIVDNRPRDKELVLTGRRAPREVIDRADLVTEMRPVKHYFEAGVMARKGVEY